MLHWVTRSREHSGFHGLLNYFNDNVSCFGPSEPVCGLLMKMHRVNGQNRAVHPYCR
jgi:hypothetical protein